MKYIKSGSDYIIRIDRGEEILTCLESLAEKEDIRLGSFSGLGAADRVKIGIFLTDIRQYKSEVYTGDFEIASLFGTVSRKDGKPYLHCHATIGNITKGETYAGHLSEARISGTCEISLRKLEGEAGRVFDEETGLTILDI